MVRSPRSLPAYDALFEPIRSGRINKSGKQLGNPDKAAQAILQLLEMPKAPGHLLLGSDALALVRAKLLGMLEDIARNEALSRSTDMV